MNEVDSLHWRVLVAFQNARVCSQNLVNDLTLATTFPSIMNAKLSWQRFWHYHKNKLVMTMPMICEFQVRLPFIVILTYPNESVMGK